MAGSAPHIPGCSELSLIGERVARSLFAAYCETIGRPVTVTVFPPLSEGRTRAGFDEAAATAQRLGAHPSVLTIHDWGHAPDGRPWVVTDPQPAESLERLVVMDGPLDVDTAIRVGILLAGALETAHRAGIVHGDVQPDRIVFGAQGEPLLVETGLAAFAVFPGLGALNNPVRYHAPPEVLERTVVAPATDVYSLATTVYALLAGRAPHQKPAEVTDSNASLLLRVLQMPVPPIDRSDLPSGLEDALAGPLSASPGTRPQQAIEVAWLLQDVQRRNGMAVTEPVVLDLDEVAHGDPTAAAGAPWAAGAAPLRHEQPGGAGSAWHPSGNEPGPGAVDRPASPTGSGARGDLSFRGPGGAAWVPGDEVDPPPPTIFPFGDPTGGAPPSFGPAPPPLGPLDRNGTEGTSHAGAGAAGDPAWPSGTPAEDPGHAATWPAVGPPGDVAAADSFHLEGPVPAEAAGALWPSPPPAGQAPDDGRDQRWPSSWPSGADPDEEPPAWAATPVTDSGVGPGGGAPTQGGGAIDDDAPFPAAGDGPDDESSGAFGATVRPPELDELPSWYTDPLPNTPGGEAASGSGQAQPDPVVDAGGPGHTGWPGGAANGSGGHGPWSAAAGDASDPWDPPGMADGTVEHRLPGAGDELRSLFGQVVGSPNGANGANGANGTNGVHDVPFTPLGDPWRGRTPDEPTAPVRLPRRGENRGWPPAPGAGSEGVRSPRPGETAHEAHRRGPHPAPHQVAPVPGDPEWQAAPRPPALPVIVLVAVVVLLALGVAWLVVAGDDGGAPASDRPRPEAVAGDSPAQVAVREVPEGLQVTWSGSDEASYVVTVLSADAPPRTLPATVGTSALVADVDGDAPVARCVTVALAGDGAPGTPTAPACTAGSTPDQMQGG